ncbi:MAG: acetylxylan esterase [Phycisphaerales bacterium JB061]
MIEPDDFDLGWQETLASVSHASRSPMHGAFWQQWHRSIDDREPVLRPIGADDDPSDPTATHAFDGAGGVPIGCRVQEARASNPSAIVILLHGYDDPPSLAESIDRFHAAEGCVVVAMRMRGYAGSRARVGDLKANELGWITTGLAEPVNHGASATEWVLSHTVADLLLGVRACRHALGLDLPVYLKGESFGGGLAVIAAARSCAMACKHPEQLIDRIAVGLPTFGDWRWRLKRVEPRSLGAGGEVKRFLMAPGCDPESIMNLLDLFDSALHAEHVDCPALVKVAVKDEIVPAPTQSAIYNALGTPPGLKGRFVTQFGHFDGGLTDLRRHAMFENMTSEFLDPEQTPFDVLARWEDVMTNGTRRPEGAA